MRIVCCINAYQEEELLPGAIRSVAHVADRIIVVDGAYRDFPRYDESTWGSTDLTGEITLNMGAQLIETPDEGWSNEIEKRNAYVRACGPGDYLFVLDADERVVFDDGEEEIAEWDRAAWEHRADWMVRHYRLDAYIQKLASFTNHLSHDDAHEKALEQATMHLHRCFAWRPDLQYRGTHHALHLGDELIHPTALEREGDCAVLPHLMIEHVQASRDAERVVRKSRYYIALKQAEASFRLVHQL